MKYKVFVDGQEGTTGLKIHDYLSSRDDLEVLSIDPENIKDVEAKRVLLNDADIVFLCLPDIAAKESVSLVSNNKTRIIDASTAHRSCPISWLIIHLRTHFVQLRPFPELTYIRRTKTDTIWKMPCRVQVCDLSG